MPLIIVLISSGYKTFYISLKKIIISFFSKIAKNHEFIIVIQSIIGIILNMNLALDIASLQELQ